MSDRPRIALKKSPLDWVLELISLLALGLLIAIPLYYFNVLPDKIPIHFNATGNPNAFANASSIWYLPAFGLLLYIGLSVLRHFLHLLNYPTKVTDNNAENLYKVAGKTLLLTKAIVIGSFCFITFKTVEISLGKSLSLGILFLPIFLGLILLIIGNLVFRTVRKK